MKKINKIALLAVAGLSFAILPAKAALDTTFNPNDVLLGFRAASGTGTATTIMVNLGAASIYRDTSTNILNIGNIGSLLDSTYGVTGGDANQWYERTTLFAGFASATNGTNIDNSGNTGIGGGIGQTDPNSTIYISTRRTAIGTVGQASSTTPGNLIALDAQSAGLQINTLGTGPFAANNSSGIANYASTTTNGWNSYVTGSSAVDFGSYNIEAAFTVGNRGTFGAAGTVEQIWDFYRVANFPSDANTGVGSYKGSFTLDNSGNVSYIAAVPEPSTYALFGSAALVIGFVAARRRKLNA